MEEAQLQVVRMACCKSRMNPVIRMDESPDEDAGAGRANKPTQIWLSGPAFAVSPQDNRFGFAGVSKNSLTSPGTWNLEPCDTLESAALI